MSLHTPAHPVLAGGAVDAPRTRGNLRRRWLCCGVVLLLGATLIGLGFALRATHNGDRLQTTGQRATATVDSIRLTRDGSGGGVSGYVTVRYTDQAGASHTVELNLGRSAPHHAEGEPIEVVYDTAHPEIVQVVGAAPDAAPLPWPMLIVLGAVFIAIGATLASRLRWLARVLRTNPWVEVESHVLEVPLGGGSQHALTLVELQGAPDEGAVLAGAASWRARPMNAFTPKAWVAGSDRRFVIAATGGAPMVRAKRIRLTPAVLDHGRPGSVPSRLRPTG
jgi:hypothetical protein